MRASISKILLHITIVLQLCGCATMLPSAKQAVITPWSDFEGAKSSYDRIIPFVTSMQTVRELGFDPYKTANMKVLNQAQVVNAVLPSPLQNPTTIPQGISDCMRVQDGCVGYLMEPSKIDQKREGNFLLDFLNFKRNTVTTGWKFSALIVVIDDTVVYKQWDGQPKIETTDDRTNPLGPLQSMGETVKVLP
jgi:hypothetical protein